MGVLIIRFDKDKWVRGRIGFSIHWTKYQLYKILTKKLTQSHNGNSTIVYSVWFCLELSTFLRYASLSLVSSWFSLLIGLWLQPLFGFSPLIMQRKMKSTSSSHYTRSRTMDQQIKVKRSLFRRFPIPCVFKLGIIFYTHWQSLWTSSQSQCIGLYFIKVKSSNTEKSLR